MGCADWHYLAVTQQWNPCAMTDWTHEPVLAHGFLHVLLCCAPPSPPLEPPLRHGLPGIARLRVEKIDRFLVDAEREVADVLDQWHAVQDALTPVLQAVRWLATRVSPGRVGPCAAEG